MFSVCANKTQENFNQSEQKAENVNFFLEVCLMELDQSKVINGVSERIFHSCPLPFWQRYCVEKLASPIPILD